MKIFSKIFSGKRKPKYNDDLLIANLKAEIFRLNTIIDNVPASIYWKDKDGIYLGQNLYTKKKMLSVEFSEAMVGKSDYDLFPKEAADQYRKNDLEVMQNRGELSIEEFVKLPNGKTLTQLSTKKPLINEKNDVVGVIGITVDVTSKKETEALKKEHEISQQKLETMEALASTLAHELRTPLAAIKLAASATKDYVIDLVEAYKLAKEAELPVADIKPSQFKMLQSVFGNIEGETNYANIIINMLLMTAEQQAIKSSDLQKYSIAFCVDEAIRRYPFQAGEHALIKWNNINDFDFMGKDILLVHILFNLLKNALYYIKAAGKGHIEIWLEPGNKMNMLHFRDTGAGISKENLPKIFDLFFTKTYHGSGIGLAFCKRVMQSFDGNIMCESVEGEYTEFILSFPTLKSVDSD